MSQPVAARASQNPLQCLGAQDAAFEVGKDGREIGGAEGRRDRGERGGGGALADGGEKVAAVAEQDTDGVKNECDALGHGAAGAILWRIGRRGRMESIGHVGVTADNLRWQAWVYFPRAALDGRSAGEDPCAHFRCRDWGGCDGWRGLIPGSKAGDFDPTMTSAAKRAMMGFGLDDPSPHHLERSSEIVHPTAVRHRSYLCPSACICGRKRLRCTVSH